MSILTLVETGVAAVSGIEESERIEIKKSICDITGFCISEMPEIW